MDRDELKMQLEEMSDKGIYLYLDGKPASAEEIATSRSVNEEMNYMPDFVMNEEGEITEIRFDQVKNL